MAFIVVSPLQYPGNYLRFSHLTEEGRVLRAGKKELHCLDLNNLRSPESMSNARDVADYYLQDGGTSPTLELDMERQMIDSGNLMN